MKFLTEKIKIITIVLTILNIGFVSMIFYINTPIAFCFATFFTIQLILLSLYTLIVIYKWLNVSLNDNISKNANSFKEIFSEVKKNNNVLNTISLEQTNYQKKLNEEFFLLKNNASLMEQNLLNLINDTVIKTIDTNTIISKDIINSATEIKKTQQDTLYHINNNLVKQTENNIILNKDIIDSISEIKAKQLEVLNKISEGIIDKIESSNNILNENIVKSSSNFELNQQKNIEHIDTKSNEIITVVKDVNQLLKLVEIKNSETLADIAKTITNEGSNYNLNLIKELNTTYNRIDALLSIHSLIKLNAPLPIMNEWRVSSDYAHEVLTCLFANKGSIIDVGSGVSTVLFGYGVKQNGNGKVIALEHSEEYYEKTTELIKAHKLEDYCEVHLCPLKEYEIEGEKWLWYDIKHVKFPTDISIISVDGPPGITQYMARYPALPIFKDFIKKNTTVFLDDGDREEEREIALRWSKEFEMNYFKYKSHKGFFKLTTAK